MQDHTDDTDDTDDIDDTATSHACPPWCGRDHRPGMHPDDQHHASPARRVAVVTGDPLLDPDDLADAGAVVARLFRRTHSELTWLEVVSEEGREVRLVATLDSARRLLGVLQDLLSGDSGELSTDR
jgi:hypothetical protein